jgi:GMP synthase (glutamine-hydrolysing)
MILVLDYGSQYTQLIARRVREQNVYCRILPFDAPLAALGKETRGVILSGGPSSVYAGAAPDLPEEVLGWGVPVLGICYGEQLLVHALGGKVEPAMRREFGRAQVEICADDDLFRGLSGKLDVWMSHGDRVENLPDSFDVIARTPSSPYAAIRDRGRRLYGVQFHPEVTHTPRGAEILRNFLFGICNERPEWTMEHFITAQTEAIRKQVGTGHVVCGLSGGVDSSVTALLLHRAIGDQLTAIFVDTGLLRLNEREEVERNFRDHFRVDLKVIDASGMFFRELAGVEDPERKRKIIGRLFIEVFEAEARKIKDAAFLAQGTLYPDVIESVAHRGPSATIKSHHNVGGLPEKMHLKLVEPLRELFKDEVRSLGRELGLPEKLVGRHPFPGPGLAVRILGEVTPDRARLLQQADAIFIEELWKWDLYRSVWQAFAVLLPVRSVGVMGDERTYDNVCALRAVTSQDGMTAEWARLPHDFLAHVANRITNEVRGFNRVVYDVSSKPPATIEWE